MGLSSSKSKTTTNQTQNQTTTGTQTPITPGYLEDAAKDYVGRIQQFGNTNPQSYVAPASSLQQQAWQQAGQLGSQPGSQQAMNMAQQAGQSPANLGGAFTYNAPQLGQAASYNAPQLGQAAQGIAYDAQAQSLLDNFQAYESPYTNQVVNASLADFDHGVEQQQARLAAQGARSGAFGGSRFGVAEAELAGNAARGRALTSAQLRDQGFRTAAGLSQADAAARQQAELFNAQNRTGVSGQNAGFQNQFGLAQAGLNESAARYGADSANQFALAQGQLNQAAGQYNAGAQQQGSQFNAGQQDAAQARALQAAQLMGALTSDQSANNRANVQTMAQLGEQQRGISQSQALAPLAQLQAMGQLSGMTPYDILVGRQVNGTQTGTMQGTNTTKQSGSLFDQMLGVAQTAAMFSDPVLKRDVERVGTHRGLGLYRYRYLWDDDSRPLRTGVMADEVETIAPHALGPVINGLRTVNYEALGLAHLVESQ